MARYDPDAERDWRVDSRLTDLEDRLSTVEDGPFLCPRCTWPYNTPAARDHCDCDDD